MSLKLWPTLLSVSFCFVILCAFSTVSGAQNKHDNIVIANASERYLFTGRKDEKGTVEVEHTSATTYLCEGYPSSIPVFEHYNNEISIDDVSIFVDGEFSKDIKPVYEYKESDNIFFSDLKLCYFSLPFKKKGATAEVIFKKTIRSPLYFTSVYLIGQRKIQDKTVKILVPEWMSLELKEMNFDGWDIKRSTEKRKDGIVYSFTIHNAPAMPSQPYTPGPSYYMPHILVMAKESNIDDISKTYFKTLLDQYNWYRMLVDSIGNDVGVIKQTAQKICSEMSGDEAKVQALYNWVQKNIRYIAFEDGIAGFKPKSAQEVLSKKYGDCKGMANLLVTMLRSMGYDARLCWLGTRHLAYDYSTPSLAINNHAIAAWMKGSTPVFLDCTEQFIRYGEIAERIQGRQVLIEDGSHYILDTLPIVHHQQNTALEQRILHIEGNDLLGKVTHTFKGESREHILALLNSVKKDHQEELIKRYLIGQGDTYQVGNFVISGRDSYNEDLKVTYDVVHKGVFATFGSEGYLDVDNRKQFARYKIDTAERQLPVCLPYKDHYVLDIQITLPPNIHIKSLPESININTGDYGFSGSWIHKAQELVYHSESWIEKTYFQTNQLSGLIKDVQSVQTFFNTQPELKF